MKLVDVKIKQFINKKHGSGVPGVFWKNGEPHYILEHSSDCFAQQSQWVKSEGKNEVDKFNERAEQLGKEETSRIYCECLTIEKYDRTAWAHIEGRDIVLWSPVCKPLDAWTKYPDFAYYIGEDLKFEIASEKHRTSDFYNIKEKLGVQYFSQNQVKEAGIRPIIETQNSSYWRYDEIENFAKLLPKKREKAIALFHHAVTKPWSNKKQDSYIFYLPSLGVFKNGISIHPKNRFSDIRRELTKNRIDTSEFAISAVNAGGGKEMEDKFKNYFSAHKIEDKIAKDMGLINYTEWYDAKILREALDFLNTDTDEIAC